MYKIFVYGTLMIDEIMERVTGKSLPSAPAVLRNYIRSKLKGAVYPGIEFWPGSYVEGKIYFGVDAQSLERLDRFEGDCYQRTKVRVFDSSGTEHEAFVYAIKDVYTYLLTGEPWELEEFRKKHVRTFTQGYEGFTAV